MVIWKAPPTPRVVIEKLPLVDPAAIVTDPGTAATPWSLLVSVTVAPPLGAAPDNVTVPCTELPPTMLEFESVREARLTVPVGGAALIVSVAP